MAESLIGEKLEIVYKGERWRRREPAIIYPARAWRWVMSAHVLPIFLFLGALLITHGATKLDRNEGFLVEKGIDRGWNGEA